MTFTSPKCETTQSLSPIHNIFLVVLGVGLGNRVILNSARNFPLQKCHILNEYFAVGSSGRKSECFRLDERDISCVADGKSGNCRYRLSSDERCHEQVSTKKVGGTIGYDAAWLFRRGRRSLLALQ